jgi:dephospho-CoA kinase
MLRVGLTGGIACGKTVVAEMMREFGCVILNADRMAHRLIEPGAAGFESVVREFGRGILDGDGHIDRPKLAEIVFADPARLAKLSAIIHPYVLSQLDAELARLEESDFRGVAVVEAALLVESGYCHRLDRLVLVWCTPEQQLERLINRRGMGGRGMSETQARQRIASQTSLEEKRKLADDEIDCSGTLADTRRQVATLVERLTLLAATTASKRF